MKVDPMLQAYAERYAKLIKQHVPGTKPHLNYELTKREIPLLKAQLNLICGARLSELGLPRGKVAQLRTYIRRVILPDSDHVLKTLVNQVAGEKQAVVIEDEDPTLSDYLIVVDRVEGGLYIHVACTRLRGAGLINLATEAARQTKTTLFISPADFSKADIPGYDTKSLMDAYSRAGFKLYKRQTKTLQPVAKFNP